jgi:hypothetical protein
MLFDERNNYHYPDYEIITEERIRNCLVSWNLDKQFPDDFKKLFRVRGVLEDDSVDQWKDLPPLIRKAIGSAINEALGGI